MAESMPRNFKIGSSTVVENDTTRAMTNEQVRDFLKAQYPEVANASIRDYTKDGVRVVEFLPQAGRKG